MRDFFKPWRRKVGIAMLVMALVATVGWVRSLSFSEGVGFSRGQRIVENHFPDQIYYCTDDKIYSEGGFLHWQHVFNDARKFGVANRTLNWWTQPLGNIYLNDDDEWLRWRWRFYGIRFGEIEEINVEVENEFGKKVQAPRQRWYFLHLPYWLIVAPLTLLSAYLLLGKPRPAKKADASPSPKPDHA